ncbi:hypothetical protein, partial [Paracoccus sp. SSK6]|uniref:hypothetical protein n=1 Tax=Paracoccus sp. SSK6 TaxID=3143131 RepID=UPI00321AFE96
DVDAMIDRLMVASKRCDSRQRAEFHETRSGLADNIRRSRPQADDIRKPPQPAKSRNVRNLGQS